MRKYWLLFWMLGTLLAQAQDDPIRRLIAEAGEPENARHVVVFDSTRVQVMESGLSYVTVHKLVKILTQEGGIREAVQHFDYDPLSAHVDILMARILRKDGSEETIPLDAALDHAAPARAIYWGAREKMLPVGRLHPGDALQIKTFRKGFTYALLQSSSGISSSDDERFVPPMRGHFYDIVPFWSDAPVKLKVYSVSLPEDKPLQYRIYNGALTVWTGWERDRKIYHFESRDIKPFQGEPYMVAVSDVAPKLLLSTTRDWEAKSLWFYGVNEDFGSFEVTPEIQARVDELTRGCRSDMEKVDVLTHWVADEIRYSGLSMGEGEGYTLHTGEMTFRDRAGVCKDKAGMLITMLRAAGLESYPAMTMAGSRIDRVPADQFNHCVTVWKRGDGDYMLLDPTWVPLTRELWSSLEQQQEYLMGVPEGADLMTTPISPPKNHPFTVRAETRLDDQGNLTGTLTVEGDGQADSRLRRKGRKFQWRSDYERALADLAPRAEILSLRFTDPVDLSRPTRIEITFRIPDYAIKAGDALILVPLAARHIFPDPALSYSTNRNTRTTPFRIRCSQLLNLEEVLRLPPGYRVTHAPEFEELAGIPADFKTEYEYNRNRLVFRQTLSFAKRIYQAEEWPHFRKVIQEANRARTAPVIITKH